MYLIPSDQSWTSKASCLPLEVSVLIAMMILLFHLAEKVASICDEHLYRKT
jgi:hypothetical protein